jgi:hypothetical protein
MGISEGLVYKYIVVGHFKKLEALSVYLRVVRGIIIASICFH